MHSSGIVQSHIVHREKGENNQPNDNKKPHKHKDFR